MDVLLHRPEKTASGYLIGVTVTPSQGAAHEVRLGFEDANFEVPHHELWDSYLPLMWVTRNGGPLFGKAERHADIRAEYPLNRGIVAFFERRARNFGLSIDVTSPTFEATYDLRTQGTTVLFGGGKDSRLLLGTLHEIGERPVAVGAEVGTYGRDIEGILGYRTFQFTMPNRMIGALMRLPRDVYEGAGIGEIQMTEPWHRFYDISAPLPLRETTGLFARLGLEMRFHAPQAVLPQNISQGILGWRYPELFAGQVSVVPHKPDIKNLNVAMRKLYAGLPYHDHCSDRLLLSMAAEHVALALTTGQAFAINNTNEVIQREVQCILRRLVARGQLSLPGPQPPESWEAPWIDHVHAYCVPDLDPRLLAIYREYFDLWSGPAESLPGPLRPYFDGVGSGPAEDRWAGAA